MCSKNFFCFRNILFFFILLPSICSTLWAETNIEQYFPKIADYRFERKELISGTSGHKKIGRFSTLVLNDYILISYSKWWVHSPQFSSTPQWDMEIYEMQDAAGAYGIFSLWDQNLQSSTERLRLSVDNRYSNNSLRFWRGNYFFFLSSNESLDNSRMRLSEIATAFTREIPQVNLHPMTVFQLPQKEIIQESIRFYLGKSSFELNSFFPQELRIAVGFQDDVEIAYARYMPSDRPLFLLGYPTIALAAHRFVELQKAMQSYFSPQGIYMKRVGVMVGIFFGPEDEARKVLDKVRYAPHIKWIYNKSPESLLDQKKRTAETILGVVTKSMFLTLFFISITISGGLGVGILRYRIQKNHPDMTIKDKLIRLDLGSIQNK